MPAWSLFDFVDTCIPHTLESLGQIIYSAVFCQASVLEICLLRGFDLASHYSLSPRFDRPGCRANKYTDLSVSSVCLQWHRVSAIRQKF